MFFDTRLLRDGLDVPADVCIVGAGAAGITLARKMASSGLRVCLMEGGGLDFSETSQMVYQGDNLGEQYDPLHISRLRFFGGSTNHWGGWTRPLDEMDFHRRYWISGSGWPIKTEDLADYYAETSDILELGPHHYDTDYWEREAGRRLAIDAGDVMTRVFRFSPPTRFGASYRQAINDSQAIYCFLNANLTDIQFNQNGDVVKRATFTTEKNTRINVQCRALVLAAGGIENARLMLALNRQHAAGIGNMNDLVGRYFSDHSGLWAGLVAFSNPKRDLSFYTMHAPFVRSTSHQPRIIASLSMSSEALTRHELPNFTAFLMASNPGITPGDDVSEGITHFSDVQRLITHQAAASRYGMAEWSPLMNGASLHHLIINAEQVPNSESRVMLSEKKDRYGMPRGALDWRFTEQDHVLHARIASSMAHEFGAAGLGRMLKPRSYDWPPEWREFGRHHMGTTRMASSASEGVVDRDCRVFGQKNLYVAGSSVFPTYGYAQPTFTLVALSLRLADHLSRTLGGTS